MTDQNIQHPNADPHPNILFSPHEYPIWHPDERPDHGQIELPYVEPGRFARSTRMWCADHWACVFQHLQMAQKWQLASSQNAHPISPIFSTSGP
jgi:hypothetical protein